MMNKIKAIVFCVGLIFNFQLSTFNSAQAQVKWHTIEEAATAKIEERLYFVDFYTSWCGYCKKMDRETFSDATVAKLLNQGRNRQHEFARGLQGYPTFVLYKADGTVLQAIPGFYSAKDFAVILWYFASGDCDKYPFERYQKIFDKEIRPTMEKALGKGNQ